MQTNMCVTLLFLNIFFTFFRVHYADKRDRNSRNGNHSIYAIIVDKCGL